MIIKYFIQSSEILIFTYQLNFIDFIKPQLDFGEKSIQKQASLANHENNMMKIQKSNIEEGESPNSSGSKKLSK